MMTAAEVRGTVFAYHQVRALMNQPLPAITRATFEAFLRQAEEDCFAVTDTSAPARWARSIVGNVLAAGVGSAVWLGRMSAHNTLRVFGISEDHAMSNQAAWKLMGHCAFEDGPLLRSAVSEIARQSGLMLRLPERPTAVDALVELVRPRCGRFPAQVAEWLIEYFIAHADEPSPYGELSRKTMQGLTEMNNRGEMAQSATASAIHGPATREDWEALVRMRMPRSALERRAAVATVKRFLLDYWEKWNMRHPRQGGTDELSALQGAGDSMRKHAEGDA